jgi:hypothetical protein
VREFPVAGSFEDQPIIDHPTSARFCGASFGSWPDSAPSIGGTMVTSVQDGRTDTLPAPPRWTVLTPYRLTVTPTMIRGSVLPHPALKIHRQVWAAVATIHSGRVQRSLSWSRMMPLLTFGACYHSFVSA